MSVKTLLGLDGTALSDSEIMARIKDALDHHNAMVVFRMKDGHTVELHLPHAEFAPYIDPWDGPRMSS